MPRFGPWSFDSGGALSLDDGDFRPLVRQKPGWALFLVQQRCGGRPARPLATATLGVGSGVREAMAAAEDAAARPVGVQHRAGLAAGR